MLNVDGEVNWQASDWLLLTKELHAERTLKGWRVIPTILAGILN